MTPSCQKIPTCPGRYGGGLVLDDIKQQKPGQNTANQQCGDEGEHRDQGHRASFHSDASIDAAAITPPIAAPMIPGVPTSWPAR